MSHVIIGGLLWEDYSHLERPISDLTASGAPNRLLLSVFTILYGFLSVLFAIGAYILLKKYAPKISQLGMGVFFGVLILSLLYNFFPQDLPGDALTFQGVMHIVVTVMIVPLTILSPILVGIGLRKKRSFHLYGYFSIMIGVFIFLTGGLTVLFIANSWPYFGVVQRLNIFSLQLWMLVTSLKLFFFEKIE